MTVIYDDLANQFKLYHYLDNINSTITQFIENNNVNVNYYYCAVKIIDNVYYIVTSNTLKNIDPGYKLITITFGGNSNNNQITHNLEIIQIYYEELSINISQKIYDINTLIEQYSLQIVSPRKYIHDVDSNSLSRFNFNWQYSNNRNELTILNVYNCGNLTSLHMFQNLQKLSFEHTYNSSIGVNIFPKMLRKITFGIGYNKPIKQNVLPEFLEKLIFIGFFNQIINKGVLPLNLKTIKFSNMFNQIIDCDVLPQSLKTIQFGIYYSKTVHEGVLPDNILKIVFVQTELIINTLNHLKLIPQQHQNKVSFTGTNFDTHLYKN
jgi:hypothetical protein